MTNLTPKYPSDSFTLMNEIVLPNDTNTLGNLMGGRLLHWMDICAAIAAQISIQCNSLPPIKFPNVLVSLGNTISFISVNESEGYFGVRFVMVMQK